MDPNAATRIEDEALAFFERDLQALDERVFNGELRAFGPNEAKILKEVDAVLQQSANMAVKSVILDAENNLSANKDEEKDFGDFKDNQFELVKQRFKEREEEIDKLRIDLRRLNAPISEIHKYVRHQQSSS